MKRVPNRFGIPQSTPPRNPGRRLEGTEGADPSPLSPEKATLRVSSSVFVPTPHIPTARVSPKKTKRPSPPSAPAAAPAAAAAAASTLPASHNLLKPSKAKKQTHSAAFAAAAPPKRADPPAASASAAAAAPSTLKFSKPAKHTPKVQKSSTPNGFIPSQSLKAATAPIPAQTSVKQPPTPTATPAAEEDDGPKCCNCKKSRCLKLYCECFAAGRPCGELCKCKDCYNHEHCHDRKKAMKAIKDRNPNAFQPKIRGQDGKVRVHSRITDFVSASYIHRGVLFNSTSRVATARRAGASRNTANVSKREYFVEKIVNARSVALSSNGLWHPTPFT